MALHSFYMLLCETDSILLIIKLYYILAAPKSTRKGKKRSIAEAGKAEVSPAPKKSKYPLRSRKQHQQFKTDEVSSSPEWVQMV